MNQEVSIAEVLEPVESLPEYRSLSVRKQSEINQTAFLVPTRNDDIKSRSKKFLFRLVQALHSSGSLSYRTEEIIHVVARALNLYVVCSVLPVSVSISFNTSSVMAPKHSETYIFKISSGDNLGKLDKLYYLCDEVQNMNIDLHEAEDLLRRIENEPPLYQPFVICIAYACTSFTGSLLFFGGDFTDALIAAFLGVVVYFISFLCTLIEDLSQIECFLSSLVVSILSYLIETYIVSGRCIFAQVFGGVVWMFPGVSIMIALLEIYSRSIVYGSARLVYAISLASQLGFGLAMGCGMCYPLKDMVNLFTSGCVSPYPPIFKVLFLPIMSISMALIYGCSKSHFPGVVLVSGSGVYAGAWAQSAMTSYSIAESVSCVFAAAVVTLMSRILGRITGHNYIIYLSTGILVLVPGSIGVRGMSEMWSGDMNGGIIFTFKMCLVGVSLAMGVFAALIPRGMLILMCTNQLESVPSGETRSGKMKIFHDPHRYDSFQTPRDDSLSYDDDDIL